MNSEDKKIGIVGLGYVGLTLATVLAEVGFDVVGVEKNLNLVELTNVGIPHFSELGLDDALKQVIDSGKFKAKKSFDSSDLCDVYIITVGTPLDQSGQARLDMIEQATGEVANHMPDGALIILRSTVKIGTSREVVKPILKSTGKSFGLAMCPERTLEGRALKELRELPQIVGSDETDARTRASALFGKLTNSVIQVSTYETAEMIKLIDNTSRDVRFAFANEVARACDALGINAHEVISSGKLGYSRTDVALPGLVGGPCLEKDPHILQQSLAVHSVELEITKASRLVNERQPEETISFIINEMSRREFNQNCKVAILGMAFKGVPSTDDLRGSMSVKVLEHLKREAPFAKICLYDPVIPKEILQKKFPNLHISINLEDAINGAQVAIIANNHPNLSSCGLSKYKNEMSVDGFIYDYWNNFSNLSHEELGVIYYAVGNLRR